MSSDSSHIVPIAVTMGESAGVGPEIIAKLWQERQSYGLSPFVVYGLKSAFTAVDNSLPIAEIAEPAEAIYHFDHALPLCPTGQVETAVIPGHLNANHAVHAISAIDQAVAATLSGQTRAVVTGPIHKQHLQTVGFKTPGHTEYLARLCNFPDSQSVMMLAAKDLRVVLATIHVPLANVSTTLRSDNIIHVGTVLNTALKTLFHIPNPNIAIAGLNPHAGENGMLGSEEDLIIKPALWALSDMGISVSGPHPADTLFHSDARKSYDAVICMYHDQGLIPIKTIDFWGGVNVTLGLPIIRTSPDHGTGLDIAGNNSARVDSFLNAFKLADRLSAQST